MEIVPSAPEIHASQLHRAVVLDKATVDVAPVSPKVEEVAITGMDGKLTSEEASGATPGATSTASADPTRLGGLTLAVTSQAQEVKGYGTVGVTWQHGVELPEDSIKVQIRTQSKGRWSGWEEVSYHADHGPDSGTAENPDDRERPGTDAVVVGDVAEVQMRAFTKDGVAPTDMKLAVIDPGVGETQTAKAAIDTSRLPDSSSTLASSQRSDTGVQAQANPGQASLAAMRVAPMPQIYSRAQWGANEKMRDASSLRYGTIQTSFVHHTVNANNYSEADVPALLRGIYAYHTKSRGWSDIGYNFLVDRFGRIWEGRYGGIAKSPVGAHTLGYNEVSFAMSAIGNFETAQPSQQIIDAFAALFAWKLSMYNIPANATGLRVKGKTFQAINGHRDAGSTDCPGKYLYAQLPQIRTLATAIQNGNQAPPVVPAMPTVPFTAPTQTPAAAAPQPTLANPRALSLDATANASIVTLAQNGDIRVVPTRGQVGFKAPALTTGSGASLGGLSAFVGDVNRDGRGDVLTLRRGVGRVFRGIKGGHLAKKGIGRTRAFKGANLLVSAGDWNRDGRPDVIARVGSNLNLFLGKPKLRWSKPILLSGGFSNYTSIAVPGDINGDGVNDVVALRNDGVLQAFAGSGLRLRPATVIKAVPGVKSIAGGGDLTGDGVADIVLSDGSSVQILSGLGAGRFGNTYGPFVGYGGIRQLSVGRFSGAGPAGLLGISGNRYFTYANRDTQNTAAALSGNLRRPAATRVLNVGDWNRDGKGDLITIEGAGDTLVFHPGRGTGFFGAAVVMGSGWKPVSSLTAVGDVTGDGKPDLVGRTSAGTVIFPGDGASGFTGSRLAPSNMVTFNSVGPGLWQASSWSVMIGSRSGVVPRVGAGNLDSSRFDAIVGSGDLDGDGYADVIARERATGVLWLVPGAAGGIGVPRFLASGFGGYTTIG
ncbi:MAG: FG-GAP-like repeat-containing protein [Nocardioidaceae bacterium]